MAPLDRGSIHFVAASDGKRLLAAILEDQDDIGQALPDLLLDVLVWRGSLNKVPITELRQADGPCLLLEGDLKAFGKP